MAAANDQDSDTSQPLYAAAICRVAVAQICLNAGYRRVEAAALRALTDIAIRYIRLLAGDAASNANSRGRTQSNIFDIAIVLESAATGRGYAGASDLTRPLLGSSVLHELRAFVAAVDEIPFPRPIRRQMGTGNTRKPRPSFAQVGKEPPLPHVPSWLPCFPEGWEKQTDSPEVFDKIVQTPAMEKGNGRDMKIERERVRFRLGFGGDKRNGKRKIDGGCERRELAEDLLSGS
ncbi:hypothetical protein KFK09_018831 [Dendrobium nobile]|uniref:Bromodomain associated domain-containing protein n=1 Tax=Dendrobium nobile TaxID=94219 RepID=A0A8T3AWW1_DENNO|nr:hypothetical protein KFK09_018831 [Dendrobium nobile]